jgi:DNA replication protein DnaC
VSNFHSVSQSLSVSSLLTYCHVSRSLYSQYGVRIPRGLLLHGRSGTGKTALARAIAARANIALRCVSVQELIVAEVCLFVWVFFIDELGFIGNLRVNHDVSLSSLILSSPPTHTHTPGRRQ